MRSVILLVDDDPFIQQLVSSVLSKRGYEVRSAFDGQEAIEYVYKDPDIALVVTDLNMPRKSGLELIRELKAFCPHLPVLVMSADYSEWWEALAAFPRIRKPFKIADLLTAVTKQIGLPPLPLGEL